MGIDRGADHGRVSPTAFVRERSIFREEEDWHTIIKWCTLLLPVGTQYNFDS